MLLEYSQVTNPPAVETMVSAYEFTFHTPTRGGREFHDDFMKMIDHGANSARWRSGGDDAHQSTQFRVPGQANSDDVLENFVGHVDDIENGWAFVTLRAPSGEILKGRYPERALSDYGILEGSRFSCSTVRIRPNEVRVIFERLPSLAETSDALQKVVERLKLDWDDDAFSEDY